MKQPTTSRKKSLRAPIRPVLVLGLLLGGGARAGDLEVDNLTVMQSATIYGGFTNKSFTFSGSVPTNGLLLYYPFSEDTGSVVPDESGNDHTGTVTGAIWSSDGISGGAYAFDGNDWIDAGDAPDLTNGEEITVAAWVRFDSIQANEIAGADSEETHPYNRRYFLGSLNSDPTHVRFVPFKNNTGYYPIVDPQAYSTGVWYHFAGTFGADGYERLYRNGQEVASHYLGGTLHGTTAPTLIGGGCQEEGGPYYLHGLLDEVRIYDRALSADEMLGLYYGVVPPPPCSASFESGIQYVSPLGDVLMGPYTNGP